MPDIHHRFVIRAPIQEVEKTLLSPAGLNAWWTLTAEGRPTVGSSYRFGFGPDYQWAGRLVELEPGRRLVWEMVEADADWEGTRVGFSLEPNDATTTVDFFHTGWRDANAHFRQSSYCWAMYLRLLGRYLEQGEVVPYERRNAA